MKTIVALAAAAVMTGAVGMASGEPVIFEGVRYQWGTHGEVFYGGVSPQYLPTNFPVANTPATQAMADRFGFPNPNYRLSRFDVNSSMQFRPLIYSDLVPYDEAGRLGFGISDARNEAYLNAPRLVAGHPRGQIAGADAVVVTSREPVRLSAAQLKAKAIPLLSWARMESARRNPELQKALLAEAAKWDAEATAKVRRELGM